MRNNILDKDFRFNKKFGQNFIFDQNFLRSVVKDAEINNETDVLEIGAGAGTLTKVLGENARKVVSYEIDTNLKQTLSENLKDSSNVEVIFKDIMKASIDEIEKNFQGDYVLIANLPYYITTPIIFKFLEEATRLTRLVIMVQLEVANRICSKAGSSEYGAINPAIDYRGTAKIVRKVSRKMFMPMPNVDSAIVRIDIDKNKYKINDRKLLDNVIKSAFQMRRKTLQNNLKNSFSINQSQLDEIFTKMRLEANVRGETLTTGQFVELSNLLSELKNKG